MRARRARRRRSTSGLRWSRPARSSLLLGVLLDGPLEGRERLVPELVEVAAQSVHPVRVELIDPTRAVGPVDHEAGVLQHPEVLGDRRPADGQIAGDLAYGTGPLGEPFK